MFTYIHSEKNTGQWTAYTAEQRAMNIALGKYHAIKWDWSSIIIDQLECDDPTHYPDICWHYQITILDKG